MCLTHVYGLSCDTGAMVTTEPVPTGNTYDKYASTNPIEQRMMRGFFAAFDCDARRRERLRLHHDGSSRSASARASSPLG